MGVIGETLAKREVKFLNVTLRPRHYGPATFETKHPTQFSRLTTTKVHYNAATFVRNLIDSVG